MRTKTYVITGATSGIGAGLIKELAEDNVIFAGYRNQAKAEELSSLGVFPFYMDYAKPETILPAINSIKSKCTKIDTLVNIAGCVVAGPVEKIEMSEIRRQFDVNVFGHLEFTKGLLDILTGGKIINVSSMASYGIFPYISPYCASKKCLDMFFNSLLIENKKNIQVVSIKPGVIATPLWGKSIEENAKYLNSCSDYEREMDFLINNAKKNETSGLSADEVVKVIMKADRAKKPKLSYTVGRDAFAASLISLLPQELLNNIIKLGIKIRMKKSG